MYNRLDFIQRANAGYIEEQYRRYRLDPSSVPEEWALFFAGFDLAEDPARRPGPAAGLSGVYGLVHAYREFGHLIAQLNPLGGDLTEHPLLDLAQFGLGEENLDQPVDPRPFLGMTQGTLRDLIGSLRETYCGTLGVEYVDVPDKERRDWLQERMEPTRNHPTLSAEDRRRILSMMLRADAFEQFLHVRYVGQKRFSLEGGATLVPMLDMLVETASSMGVEYLALGMAHRGRLNVLAHIVGKPLERILSEFQSDFAPVDVMGHGDVKYHLGFASQRTCRNGRQLLLDLHYNPSHLEFVNPVLLGAIRARQDAMNDTERARGVPVLIHGDASLAGEGIVPETLTMSQLSPYDTGGTIHIVINNQIGFTTTPWHARATRYCTDLARVIEAPVLHVNGDDPEAAVHAITLAMEYRARFKRDILVDMICYRKYGHNELDDPTFTQPAMYQKIAAHTPASRTYARRLIESGVIDEPGLQTMEQEIEKILQGAHQRVRDAAPAVPRERLGGLWKGLDWAGEDWSADTAAPRATLERVMNGLATLPQDFEPHPKIAKLNADRQAMLREDRIDWGLGEALALGSLVLEGQRVRISGQDTGRGTFSHRHAILRDHRDGHRYIPLEHLSADQARFTIFDTPLNESGCLGFEYGFSAADPRTLVIWEAQFGDFANVAQVYIDQFLASAESKWKRMSGVVLLLPHGYEGQGPEHSSARLERFLQLCAEGNQRVAYPSTPAQYFHILRRQAHLYERRPLILMQPKSLLRLPEAASKLSDIASGSFKPVIDDPVASQQREAITRLVFCTGKIYYDLAAKRAPHVALVRVEELYPWPGNQIAQIVDLYPAIEEVVWAQEEPKNQGAWSYASPRLRMSTGNALLTRYIGRPDRASPAEGYAEVHKKEQERIIAEVNAPLQQPAGPKRRGMALKT